MNHLAHINESRRTYKRVTSHTQTSHVTHINKSRRTYKRVMSQVALDHKQDDMADFLGYAHRQLQSGQVCATLHKMCIH